MTLSSARSKWLRNSLWARRAPSACSADRCHGPTSLSSAEGSPWQSFTGETQPSAWRASGLGNPQRITLAVKDTSARSELFGAIPGSSCQDNSLGVFCLPYHRTIQQSPGVVSLFLLATYPLPLLSFFLSFSLQDGYHLVKGPLLRMEVATLILVVKPQSLSIQEFLSGTY